MADKNTVDTLFENFRLYLPNCFIFQIAGKFYSFMSNWEMELLLFNQL
jgi:hypothetical protein